MERYRAKRYHYEEGQGDESDERHKRYRSSSHSPRPPPRTGGEIIFRILCPEPQVGSIIGKGGSIVKSLRQETGARITIQDVVPGAEERVVLISSYDDGEREAVSPAQEALFRVYSRIFEAGVDEEDRSRVIATRLLVPNNQVGCLLGKGGKIIEQMREDTKAKIRILSRDQLPLCTLPSDEIVQIVGQVNVVKKALILISSRLKGNLPRERERDRERGQERSQPPSHATVYSPDRHVTPMDGFSPHGGSLSRRARIDGSALRMRSTVGSSSNRSPVDTIGPPGSGRILPEVMRSNLSDDGPSVSGEELVFRVLCPNAKIGSIIGRGGSIIRSLQEEIGVKIKVTDSVPGSEERIIIISANEVLDDNLSPAQEALLHIQSQIVDLGPDKDGVITTKLLVPTNQIGCLLGKGGSIISEMRRETRANIRILPREDLPPCALETDGMVQIVGDIRVAREALVQVTSRLRNYLHREMAISGSVMSSSLGAPPDVSSKRRLGPGSPSRLYSAGSSFQAGRRSLATSPDTWPSKGASGRSLADHEEIAVNPVGSTGFGRSVGGLVTKTTVEVAVPEHAIPALIGNSSSTILQISEISGAKVNLLEARAGSERVVEISGTPEQTHSAQSLLQAFILNGHSALGSYFG